MQEYVSNLMIYLCEKLFHKLRIQTYFKLKLGKILSGVILSFIIGPGNANAIMRLSEICLFDKCYLEIYKFVFFVNTVLFRADDHVTFVYDKLVSPTKIFSFIFAMSIKYMYLKT